MPSDWPRDGPFALDCPIEENDHSRVGDDSQALHALFRSPTWARLIGDSEHGVSHGLHLR
jgi:hypothetical protein